MPPILCSTGPRRRPRPSTACETAAPPTRRNRARYARTYDAPCRSHPILWEAQENGIGIRRRPARLIPHGHRRIPDLDRMVLPASHKERDHEPPPHSQDLHRTRRVRRHRSRCGSGLRPFLLQRLRLSVAVRSSRSPRRALPSLPWPAGGRGAGGTEANRPPYRAGHCGSAAEAAFRIGGEARPGASPVGVLPARPGGPPVPCARPTPLTARNRKR